ncbi:MAG TPA: hypothetical protein VM282_12935 [Acidimicrobiales bacterium]|nr:hypothetical protein [Acidimicrobiales bacterium]
MRRRDDGEFELLCASTTVPDLTHAAAPIHLNRGAAVESTIEEAECSASAEVGVFALL